MSKKVYRKVTVNIPCICCNSIESYLFLQIRFVQYPGIFDYRKCSQCGLVFNSPRFADLSILYDKDYFLYHQGNMNMRGRVLSQIQHLVIPGTLYSPGKHLIELGSGRGHLLSSLRRMGYDVQGLELSTNAIAQSRADYAVPVFQGTAEQFLRAGHKTDFDIVLACTVIEHVSAPDQFVKACAALLKTGGVLVMDMPNIDSFNAQAAGHSWDMYQKYHVYLFGLTTIKLLLERHNFEVVETFTYNNFPLARRRLRELKMMRQMLLLLDSIGLYQVVRYWYRARQKNRPGSADTFRPITEEEIEGLKPYKESRDAKGPLASMQRGNHLVVIARKIGG